MDFISISLLILRCFLACVFLFAGWSKLRNRERFQKEVAEFELLPKASIKLFATTLPFIEIGVGVMLAVGWWIKIVAIQAALLLLIFIVAVASSLLLGRTPSCGCFGENSNKQIDRK